MGQALQLGQGAVAQDLEALSSRCRLSVRQVRGRTVGQAHQRVVAQVQVPETGR